QTIAIEAPTPVQHMPEMLALPRYAIVKRQMDSTGAALLIGTGPYKLSQWQIGERAQFTVNEDYRNGRAFPDAIEFQMGVGLREQLVDRQLGPNAAAEVGIDQIRQLEQSSQNIAISRPADLLAIAFLQADSPSRSGRKPVDPRVREALSLAINRAAISTALL